MKIRELHIDRFGRWTGLSLRGLSDGLNVFLGSNESGKTTLLHFLRTVLFGFSPERRQRFTRPHTLAGGGSVIVAAAQGRATISRHDEGDLPGRLQITDGAGRHMEPQRLTELLGVEESVFNNVFAVGLWEMQELATLSDGEVAAKLYDLATGLDAASLRATLREVRESRQRLLSVDGQPSYLAQHTEQRRRLATELEQGKVINRRYAQLQVGRRELDAEARQAEQTLAELQARLDATDAAIAVRDPWAQRSQLRSRLAALGNPAAITDDMARRRELCKDHIRRFREKTRSLRQRRAKLRSARATLSVNETWLRHSPSLIALADQREWIATLEQRSSDLQAEVDELKRQIGTDEKRLGMASQKSAAAQHVAPQLSREVRPLDQALRDAAQRHGHLEQKASELEQTAASFAQQVEAALAEQGEDDLPTELERARGWADTLRRRLDLDDDLGRMEQSLAELEENSLAPLDEPLASKKSMIGLGIFVVSVPMIFAAMLFGGGMGWVLGLLGLGGLAAGGWMEVRSKGSVAQVLTNQQRIEELQEQIEAAQFEREQLDEQIPEAEEPLADRLHEAEQQITVLEDLLPLDEQRQDVHQQAEEARTRAEEAAEEHLLAEETYNEALGKASMAPGAQGHQLPDRRDHSDHLAETQQRLHRRERELHETKRTYQDFLLRIERLFSELGLPPAAGAALAQLQELRHKLLQHEETWRRRERLLAQSRHLWRRLSALCRQGKRWSRRRRALLRRAGAADETEFSRLIEQFGQVRELRTQIEVLDREIAGRLGHGVSSESVGALLDGKETATLPQLRRELHAQLQRVQHDLLVCQKRRGDIDAELKRLAKDRSLAEKTLELGAADEQWAAAAKQWQLLAATSLVLDSVREVYETKRQPEVLQDASRYLAALTEGKYLRVWAPLGEELLRVDAAGGQTFDVPLLSRGTREQLFLTLRLAFVRSYARRSVELPLALDDVLVNFDARRTRAAAKLLRDYAQEGQQLLIFTCHEHVAEIFRTLAVPVYTLPEQGEEMLLDVRVDGPHEGASKLRVIHDESRMA